MHGITGTTSYLHCGAVGGMAVLIWKVVHPSAIGARLDQLGRWTRGT